MKATRKPVKTPVSFTKLFSAKRAMEKTQAAADKAEQAYTELLTRCSPLSGRIATYNNQKYYVTIVTSTWRTPELKLQKVQE